jgi:hypothetical protein
MAALPATDLMTNSAANLLVNSATLLPQKTLGRIVVRVPATLAMCLRIGRTVAGAASPMNADIARALVAGHGEVLAFALDGVMATAAVAVS